MRKKLFFQFFAITFLSVVLMFVCGIIAVNLNSKEMMRERLAEETQLACELVNEEGDFENFAKYENNSAFRVTIMDLDGTVLYETDTKSPLENHVDRAEVKYALEGKPQTVERYSETFGYNMTYYAMKTTLSDNSEVIVRLAVKSSQITEYFNLAIPIMVIVLVAALVVSLILAELFSRKFSNKFVEVGQSLRSLNASCYEPIKTDSSEPELFSILNEINVLNENTHNNMQRIADEQQKLMTVLENVSQGIVAIDADKKVLFANKSILGLFSAEPNVIGKEFVYLIDDMALYEKISRHLGDDYASEYEYKGKQISVVIRRIADENVASIVILSDVTQEKAMAKQKSDFFANASHELKTPVTVMQGLSEILLEKETIDEGSKKQIERIHKESMRLGSLISDMLKLSKLERGEEVEVAYSNVNLKEVAEEVVAELSGEIAEKNLAVTINGAGVISAESKKIYELIENLCSNAVHYNKPNGKIEVLITEDKETVSIKVSDTGIGIEKEHLPRLCERFYRVDKSHSKKTGGTGLGLAIVKHICVLYNAKLSIESDFGLGTSVTVSFHK